MIAHTPSDEVPAASPRRLKRREYDLLVAHYAFEDEAVELLFGEIHPMSPQKPAHRIVTQRIGECLTLALAGRAKVQSHSPISAAEESCPEPDVSVYAAEDDLAGEHPTHVHLVVEVSLASRHRDLGVKRRLYALTGIPEYWVIDVARREVRVMRDPGGDDYGTVATYALAHGAVLTFVAFPDVRVAIDPWLDGISSE